MYMEFKKLFLGITCYMMHFQIRNKAGKDDRSCQLMYFQCTGRAWNIVSIDKNPDLKTTVFSWFVHKPDCLVLKGRCSLWLFEASAASLHNPSDNVLRRLSHSISGFSLFSLPSAVPQLYPEQMLIQSILIGHSCQFWSQQNSFFVI